MIAYDPEVIRRQVEALNPNIKTFSDRLKERRSFVQQVVEPGMTEASQMAQSGIIGGQAAYAPQIDTQRYGGRLEEQANQDLAREQAYGLELYKMLNDPDMQAPAPLVGPDGKQIPSGLDAVAEVRKQGGAEFITGGTQEERNRIAEEILLAGGVAEWKKQLPLNQLLTPTEQTDVKNVTDLIALLDMASNQFSGGDKWGGTGPLAQLIPGFAAGEETREQRRRATDIQTLFQKSISGAAISEQEAKRLRAFLPTAGKTESENAGDIAYLRKRLQINMDIFEKGKKEGLTANQAYQKYGPEIFAQYGETFPDNTSSSTSKTSGVVLMQSPDGAVYEVDGSEVEEAEKNGWKRK